MIVLWNGSDLLKGFFDPKTGWLDLVSSRPSDGGQAFTAGESFSLSVDEGGSFCHLGLDVGEAIDSAPITRPDEVRDALDAEVELPDDRRPTWSFDSTAGSLCVSFEGVEPIVWGRIGDNLLWLALDREGRLAGLVFKGVSRDPGGNGQAIWLDEVGL